VKFRNCISQLGFSVMIPDNWNYVENTEKIDLQNEERERQKKWLEVGEYSNIAEKAARIFIETLSGLSTAVQCMIALSRKVFYETFLGECKKVSEDIWVRDKTNVAKMKFLLSAHKEASKEWTEFSATILLIALQKTTDDNRLRAKEDLGAQLGYFIVGNDKDKDLPNLCVIKLGMRANMTPMELYIKYKQSLPVWF
jgi:hypothetical protein